MSSITLKANVQLVLARAETRRHAKRRVWQAAKRRREVGALQHVLEVVRVHEAALPGGALRGEQKEA